MTTNPTDASLELQIVHLINDPKENERLQIHVLADTDLGNFSIDDPYGNSYQFAPQKVKRGDKVILFTKAGEPFSILPDGEDDLTESIYTCFWGINTDSWNVEEDSLLLLKGDEVVIENMDDILYINPS